MRQKKNQSDLERLPKNLLVSVVIPAYNEEKFIDVILESLVSQDYSNFEVIVVDNASTDTTALIAEAYGARVIKENRRGVGFARQAGFEKAKGEIIATTDADTKVPTNWVSSLVKRFQENPEMVAFGGQYKLYSGPLVTRFIFHNIIWPLWLLDRKINNGWSLSGANMAIRREAFFAAQGFDTELRIGEDAEIALRLRKYGKVIIDHKFLVQTSGRRFRKGILKAGYDYLPSLIGRTVFKKKVFNKLNPIREESTSAWALLVPALIVFFCSFFVPVVYAHAANFEDREEQKIVVERQLAAQYIHQKEDLVENEWAKR